LRVAVPLSFGPTHFAPVLAEMARRHPQLQIQTCYTDRFVDLIAEGYDCGIRVGYLADSNLIGKRIGPIEVSLVASPTYIKAHGSPQRPEELAAHQAVMQSTEAWQFLDGGKVVSVRPHGRFKADNGVALVAAAAAGLGVAYLPDCLTYDSIVSGALVPIMPAASGRGVSGAPTGAAPGAENPRAQRTADSVLRKIPAFCRAASSRTRRGIAHMSYGAVPMSSLRCAPRQAAMAMHHQGVSPWRTARPQ
jgi:DNA-binding transcriptional LysR family regulator